MKIVLVTADGIRAEPFEHPGCRYFVRPIFPTVRPSLHVSAQTRVPDVEERRYEMSDRIGPDTFEFREVYLPKFRGIVPNIFESEKLPGVMIQAEPTTRTCSVCSRTCDVGKCWWCGNE